MNRLLQFVRGKDGDLLPAELAESYDMSGTARRVRLRAGAPRQFTIEDDYCQMTRFTVVIPDGSQGALIRSLDVESSVAYVLFDCLRNTHILFNTLRGDIPTRHFVRVPCVDLEVQEISVRWVGTDAILADDAELQKMQDEYRKNLRLAEKQDAAKDGG